MSDVIKFEFDMEEVFEGIKEGCIRELAHANFEGAARKAIAEIKEEFKAKLRPNFSDECKVSDEIRAEVKREVFERLIQNLSEQCENKFKAYADEQLAKNSGRLEQMRKEIKEEVSGELYRDLINEIRSEVSEKVADAAMKLCDAVNGESVKIDGTDTSINKAEYEELLARDRKLRLLEEAGVDNWTGYEDALEDYEV